MPAPPPLPDDARFALSPTAVARRIDDDTVFVELARGHYFTCDATGSCVWELLTRGRSVNEIVAEVTSRYPGERERIPADVRAFLRTLVDADLVALIP